jgi:DNA-binding MarR family transcriptional regulator
MLHNFMAESIARPALTGTAFRDIWQFLERLQTIVSRKRAAPPEPAAAAPLAPARAVDYGPLNARLGYGLRRAQIAIFADFFRAFAAVDIRPVQYSILTIIEQNPGLFQTQVADALGIKKTNFVAMIVALEKRGLVKRVPLEHDRRSYGLYLTDQGAAFMPDLHALAAAHEARIIEKVGAETHAALFAPMKAIAEL